MILKRFFLKFYKNAWPWCLNIGYGALKPPPSSRIFFGENRGPTLSENQGGETSPKGRGSGPQTYKNHSYASFFYIWRNKHFKNDFYSLYHVINIQEYFLLI